MPNFDNEEQKEEYEALKKRADLMNIKYSPNIGLDALRNKVNDAITGKNNTDENEDKVVKTTSINKDTKIKNAKVHPKILSRDRANMLVRVIVTCRNPNKKEWKGEIIAGGNAQIGSIKKFIAFNVPYYVPQIILNAMKERMYSRWKSVKINGQETKQCVQEKEFAIEYLPPLSEKEFKDLATQQAVKGSVGE